MRNNRKQKFIWLLPLFFLIGQIFFASSSIAQTAPAESTNGTPNLGDIEKAKAAQEKKELWFRPNVPIPGMDLIFTEKRTKTEIDPATKKEIKYTEYKIDQSAFGNYIKVLYKYAGIFAGAVAMFMLVYAGWQWLMAAGNSSKVKMAEDTIYTTLVGLAFLFGGYLLLSQISINLVNFKPLAIKEPTFSKIGCEQYTKSTDCTANQCKWIPAADQTVDTPERGTCVPLASTNPTCQNDALVKPIVSVVGLARGKFRVTASDPLLLPQVSAALGDAVGYLVGSESLTVTSAYRTWSEQKVLYDCYQASLAQGSCPSSCNEHCNLAADPDKCSDHQTGIAVDICLANSDIDPCNTEYMTRRFNCLDSSTAPCTPALQNAEKRLQNIMNSACFTRLPSEWWHYTYTGPC